MLALLEQEPGARIRNSANGAHQAPAYLLCAPGPHPFTHALVCPGCRCFPSTYYVPGTTDANKAIHSFIPFFLLPFDKYLGEKRSYWKV